MATSALSTRLTPGQKFGVAALVVAVGLAFWVGWLYPLWPTTVVGWIAVFISGVAVVAWAAGCVVAILWLQRQREHVLLFKFVGVVVALSLGVGIFAAAFEARAFISGNFSYFGRT